MTNVIICVNNMTQDCMLGGIWYSDSNRGKNSMNFTENAIMLKHIV